MTRLGKARMLPFAVLLSASVVACGNLSGPVSASGRTPGDTPTLAPPTAVLAAVQGFAASGTVTGPVEWIATTTRKAADLTSAQARARDTPIYIVQAQGRFRLDNVPRPSGAQSPVGTVLMTYFPCDGDASLGASGLVLSSDVTDLAPFGTVHTFDPASA